MTQWHRFGIDVFPQETSKHLMALMLISDMRSSPVSPLHPVSLFQDNACHGGAWTAPFEFSTWVYPSMYLYALQKGAPIALAIAGVLAIHRKGRGNSRL